MLICLGIELLRVETDVLLPLSDSYLPVRCLLACMACRLLPCNIRPCNGMAKLLEASCIASILNTQYTFCEACKTPIDFAASLGSCLAQARKAGCRQACF